MDIKLIRYNFNLKYDNIDSKVKKTIDEAQFDELINAAVRYFYKVNYANFQSKGFEGSQANYDKLSKLVVKSPSVQPGIPFVNNSNNIYEFQLNDLQYSYMHMIRSSISIEECTDLINLDIIQHDDLDHVLNNSYRKPSLQWRRGIANYGISNSGIGRSLYAYTSGEFTPIELFAEYIRFPNEASLGGYSDIDGNVKVATDLDVNEVYHDEIIDIAVNIASGIIPHEGRFQTSNLILKNTD